MMVAPSRTSASASSTLLQTLFFTGNSSPAALLDFVLHPFTILHLVALRHLNEHAVRLARRNESPLQPGQRVRTGQFFAGEGNAGLIEVFNRLGYFVGGEGDMVHPLAIFLEQLEVVGVFAFKKLE